MDSTWSTIDSTAEIDDLVNEGDLETFLVEPILDPSTCRSTGTNRKISGSRSFPPRLLAPSIAGSR